jgi:hypothetical protein
MPRTAAHVLFGDLNVDSSTAASLCAQPPFLRRTLSYRQSIPLLRSGDTVTVRRRLHPAHDAGTTECAPLNDHARCCSRQQ